MQMTKDISEACAAVAAVVQSQTDAVDGRIVQLKICHVGRPFARIAGGCDLLEAII